MNQPNDRDKARHWTEKGMIKTYENNFRLIKEHDIQKGDKFILKDPYFLKVGTVTSIHPLYGWVETTPYTVKQDLSNIDDYAKERVTW